MTEDDAMTAHGGNVEVVGARYGLDPDEVIDFSANINPGGPPRRVLERLARDAADARGLARYPDPSARRFREAVAAALGVRPESIVPGNGTAALVAAVVRALDPSSCLVPAPAFGEYARVLARENCHVAWASLDPDLGFALDPASIRHAFAARPQLCILTNPHNPSGALAAAATLREILAATNASGTTVMLDEAFIDYAPGESLARDAADAPNLVVLRSVTKFFGIPALRVGYAVAGPSLAARIRAQLDPWPVTSLAANAAVEAVGDVEFAQLTRAANDAERERLRRALGVLCGVRVFPSAANFLLLELGPGAPPAAVVCERLVREHKVLVRDCGSFDRLEPDRFIRVCVRTRADNELLVDALRNVLDTFAAP